MIRQPKKLPKQQLPNQPLTAQPAQALSQNQLAPVSPFQRSTAPIHSHSQPSQYGYFFSPTQYANPNNIRIFDAQGNAQACPRCCSSRVTQPGLAFKYSTCCGKVLCEPCQKVPTDGPCDTPGCIGRIDRSSWTSLPIDMYRYDLEVKQRHALSRLRELDSMDFKTAKELTWDGFQEELQLLIYDLTFSNIPLEQRKNKIDQIVAKFSQQIKQKEERLGNQENQNEQAGHKPSLHATAQANKAQPIPQRQNMPMMNSYAASVHDIYAKHRIHAIQLKLELYDEKDWEATYRPQLETAYLDPTVHANVQHLRAQNQQINEQRANTAMNMTAQDTTMGLDPQPRTTAPQESEETRKFQAHVQETEAQLKALSHQWMRSDRANASGYDDMSYVPITTQYVNFGQSLLEQERDQEFL